MAGEKDEVFNDFNLLDEEMGDFFESKFSDSGQDNNPDDGPDTNPKEDEVDEFNNNDGNDEEESAEEQVEDNEAGEDADNPEEQNNSSSPLIPYAKYLKEEGILPNFNLETFDGSIDGLRDGMFSEIMDGVNVYKDSLPEPIKHLINNYEQGVALKDLLEIDANRTRYSSYNDEVLKDENAQKQLMREYLSQTTRFSQEKIEKEINRLSDLQELEDEAKAVLPELLAMQADMEQQLIAQAEQQRQTDEQNRLQELETLRSTLEATEELIPGTKISTTLRQKIYKNLTTPVAYSEEGIPLNKLGYYRAQNPVQTEILLNYIFEATNEFKDWSIFGKAVKRSVISDIENAARSMDNNFNNNRTAPRSNNTATSNFLKEIDNFNF